MSRKNVLGESKFFFKKNGFFSCHPLMRKKPTRQLIPKLDLVYIGFDTATFDRVDRDIKNTPETQIALLGGTFGLFTVFSILSGVEIVFFAFKSLFRKFRKF